MSKHQHLTDVTLVSEDTRGRVDDEDEENYEDEDDEENENEKSYES